MPEELLYIGVKVIKAYKMSECEFLSQHKNKDVTDREDQPGYCVKYPDGYISWSPKNVFESAYRVVSDKTKAFINE